MRYVNSYLASGSDLQVPFFLFWTLRIFKGKHIEKNVSTPLPVLKLSNAESLSTLEAYLETGEDRKKSMLILK